MMIRDGLGNPRDPAAAELPFPGYDALGPAELQQRVLTVDEDGVYTLLMYERRHGNRAPMIDVLQRRLASLRTWPASPSLSQRRRQRRRLMRRRERH